MFASYGVLSTAKTFQPSHHFTSTNGLTIFATNCVLPIPLNYSDANNPETYAIGAPATAMSAAYICYVPEGWYGNVGIDFTSIPNRIWACPDGATPGTANNPDIYGGFGLSNLFTPAPSPETSRNLQVFRAKADYLPAMSGTRLRGLHFILFNNQKGFCPTVIQIPIGEGSPKALVSSLLALQRRLKLSSRVMAAYHKQKPSPPCCWRIGNSVPQPCKQHWKLYFAH